MYALIFGSKAEANAQAIMSGSDIRDLVPFTSISDFVAKSIRQGLRFERIVILAQSVSNGKEYSSLLDLVQSERLTTSIVMLVRGYEESDIYALQEYYRHFISPIYTDYTLGADETPSIDLMERLLTERIDTIRLNHSSKRDYVPSVKVRTDKVEESEPKAEVAPAMKANSGVVKSFSFGGKVFGKSKLTKNERSRVSALMLQANAIMGV